MAQPLRITFPGAFYHITSRGNERKDVFKSRRDREKLLGYLDSAVSQACKRFKSRIQNDRKLKKKVEYVDNKL